MWRRQMSSPLGRGAGVPTLPRFMPFFNPVTKFFLAAGVPLGPNRLVTIRGRKSGLPHTTALAIINVSGRRWVWSPWGEGDWARNLRAAEGDHSQGQEDRGSKRARTGRDAAR